MNEWQDGEIERNGEAESNGADGRSTGDERSGGEQKNGGAERNWGDERDRGERVQKWLQLTVMILCIVSLAVVGISAGKALLDNKNTQVSQGEGVEGSDRGDGDKEVEQPGEKAEESGGQKLEETEPKPEPKPEVEQPEKAPTQPIEQPNPPVRRPAQPVEVPSEVEGNKVIALTFDDGPSTATTPRLLDILQDRGVHATFFVLGNLAVRSPDLVRREEAEGHEVASHTPYHHQLTKLSATQVQAEAAEMDRIFREILGHVPPFTRPPYGSYNATVGRALGQPMILWSIDPRDWADRNANIVCTRVTSAARDGAIILVHDIHATTVEAVPCIIDNLRARGYSFLTVSELAVYRGVQMVNGVAYGSF